MDRGLGRCLWLDRSCDEGQARQRRAATLTATKDVWFLTLLFCGRFLQAGKPPAPSGPAAGACMPGTAARQIRGELDWLCLENWVVGWESWQCCKFRRGRRNTWGSKRWKSCTACLRLSLRQALGTGPVSLHALRWGTCTKRSLHGLGYRKCSSVQSRAGFKCQHVRRGCGAPAGQGGAEVSWCVHANPCRHPVSLIQVLSEKSESTCHRSDILHNSISSPCVALGSAHALSRWTLNICCLCCQLPATPCPSAKTSCKSLSFQSGRTE